MLIQNSISICEELVAGLLDVFEGSAPHFPVPVRNTLSKWKLLCILEYFVIVVCHPGAQVEMLSQLVN